MAGNCQVRVWYNSLPFRYNEVLVIISFNTCALGTNYFSN